MDENFLTLAVTKFEYDLDPNQKPQKLFYVIKYKDSKWTAAADGEKRLSFKWPLNISITISKAEYLDPSSTLIVDVMLKSKKTFTSTQIPLSSICTRHLSLNTAPTDQYFKFAGKVTNSSYSTLKLIAIVTSPQLITTGLRSKVESERKYALTTLLELATVSKNRDKLKNSEGSEQVNKISSYISEELVDALSHAFELHLAPDLRRPHSNVVEYVQDPGQLQLVKDVWLALANVDTPVRARLVQARMLDALLDFMATPDEKVMALFAECLKPFFTFADFQKVMVKTGGIMDRLINFLSSDKLPFTQLKSLEVLLYFDDVYQKTMLQRGVLARLLALVRHEHAPLQAKALELIIFFDSKYQSEIITHGLIGQLIELLDYRQRQDGKEAPKETELTSLVLKSLSVIQHFCVHHRQQLVAGGLVRPLVRTLAIESTKVKLQTLDLLFKMATMEELLANGFFDYIPDLLKEKDSRVLALALEVVYTVVKGSHLDLTIVGFLFKALEHLEDVTIQVSMISLVTSLENTPQELKEIDSFPVFVSLYQQARLDDIRCYALSMITKICRLVPAYIRDFVSLGCVDVILSTLQCPHYDDYSYLQSLMLLQLFFMKEMPLMRETIPSMLSFFQLFININYPKPRIKWFCLILWDNRAHWTDDEVKAMVAMGYVSFLFTLKVTMRSSSDILTLIHGLLLWLEERGGLLPGLIQPFENTMSETQYIPFEFDWVPPDNCRDVHVTAKKVKRPFGTIVSGVDAKGRQSSSPVPLKVVASTPSKAQTTSKSQPKMEKESKSASTSASSVLIVGNKPLPKRGNYTFSLKLKFVKGKEGAPNIAIGFIDQSQASKINHELGCSYDIRSLGFFCESGNFYYMNKYHHLNQQCKSGDVLHVNLDINSYYCIITISVGTKVGITLSVKLDCGHDWLPAVNLCATQSSVQIEPVKLKSLSLKSYSSMPYEKKLTEWVKSATHGDKRFEGPLDWTLLYKSSVCGVSPQIVTNAVEDKGPVIVLLELENGVVFGGFSTFLFEKFHDFEYDFEFLFILESGNSTMPIKQMYHRNNNKFPAVKGRQPHCIVFGNHDIVIDCKNITMSFVTVSAFSWVITNEIKTSIKQIKEMSIWGLKNQQTLVIDKLFKSLVPAVFPGGTECNLFSRHLIEKYKRSDIAANHVTNALMRVHDRQVYKKKISAVLYEYNKVLQEVWFIPIGINGFYFPDFTRFREFAEENGPKDDFWSYFMGSHGPQQTGKKPAKPKPVIANTRVPKAGNEKPKNVNQGLLAEIRDRGPEVEHFKEKKVARRASASDILPQPNAKKRNNTNTTTTTTNTTTARARMSQPAMQPKIGVVRTRERLPAHLPPIKVIDVGGQVKREEELELPLDALIAQLSGEVQPEAGETESSDPAMEIILKADALLTRPGSSDGEDAINGVSNPSPVPTESPQASSVQDSSPAPSITVQECEASNAAVTTTKSSPELLGGEASQLYETLSETGESASKPASGTASSNGEKALVFETLSETMVSDSELDRTQRGSLTVSRAIQNDEPLSPPNIAPVAVNEENEQLRSGLAQAMAKMKNNQSHLITSTHDMVGPPDETVALPDGEDNTTQATTTAATPEMPSRTSGASATPSNAMSEQERVQSFFAKKKPAAQKTTQQRTDLKAEKPESATSNLSQSRVTPEKDQKGVESPGKKKDFESEKEAALARAAKSKSPQSAELLFDESRSYIVFNEQTYSKPLTETEIAKTLKMHEVLRVQDLSNIFDDTCSLWFCDKGPRLHMVFMVNKLPNPDTQQLEMPFLTHFLLRNGLDDIAIQKGFFWIADNIEEFEITQKHKCYSYVNQAIFDKCVKYKSNYKAIYDAKGDDESDSDEDSISFNGLPYEEMQEYANRTAKGLPWLSDGEALAHVIAEGPEEEGTEARTTEEIESEKQTNDLLITMRDNQRSLLRADMINKRMDEEIHGNQDIRELMEMGFDYEISLTAAKKYPGNLALAINALMDNPERIRSEYVPYEPEIIDGPNPHAANKSKTKERLPRRHHSEVSPSHFDSSSTSKGQNENRGRSRKLLKKILLNDDRPPVGFFEFSANAQSQKTKYALLEVPLVRSTQGKYIHVMFISDEAGPKRSPPSLSFITAAGHVYPPANDPTTDPLVTELPVRIANESQVICRALTEGECDGEGGLIVGTSDAGLSSSMMHVRGLQRHSRQCMRTAWPKRGPEEAQSDSDKTTTASSTTTSGATEEVRRTEKSTKRDHKNGRTSESGSTTSASSTSTTAGRSDAKSSPAMSAAVPDVNWQAIVLQKPEPRVALTETEMPQPEDFFQVASSLEFVKIRRVVKFESVKRKNGGQYAMNSIKGLFYHLSCPSDIDTAFYHFVVNQLGTVTKANGIGDNALNDLFTLGLKKQRTYNLKGTANELQINIFLSSCCFCVTDIVLKLHRIQYNYHPTRNATLERVEFYGAHNDKPGTSPNNLQWKKIFETSKEEKDELHDFADATKTFHWEVNPLEFASFSAFRFKFLGCTYVSLAGIEVFGAILDRY